MATVHDTDYRIEMQSFMVLQGWSARAQVWSFRSGTALVESLVLPTRSPIPSREVAQAYAETVAHQWVDQRPEPSREPPLHRPSARTQDEQRGRAATYGEHLRGANRERETLVREGQ